MIPNDDIDDVVFIARISIRGRSNKVSLMDWDPECNSNPEGPSKQLVIDKSWCNDKGNFALPLPIVSYIDGYDSPFGLTLHTIDTKYYQVASLLTILPWMKMVVTSKKTPKSNCIMVMIAQLSMPCHLRAPHFIAISLKEILDTFKDVGARTVLLLSTKCLWRGTCTE